MKRLAGVITLLLVSACGSGVTEKDLEPVVAPIVQSQDLLENFENQVSAGLTYGDMLSEWPAVSAKVIGLIDDIADDIDAVVDLPEVDREELLAYGMGVAEAHDRWAATVQNVGDFLRDDGTESAVASSYRLAGVSMADLDELRAAAEAPGAALSATTAS